MIVLVQGLDPEPYQVEATQRDPSGAYRLIARGPTGRVQIQLTERELQQLCRARYR